MQTNTFVYVGRKSKQVLAVHGGFKQSEGFVVMWWVRGMKCKCKIQWASPKP